jgi:hypothetical protein
MESDKFPQLTAINKAQQSNRDFCISNNILFKIMSSEEGSQAPEPEPVEPTKGKNFFISNVNTFVG